ncbi:kelch repeat protein [Stachybotrys elegans]|uniref:Kelch repeat protein n=1 Tax=Stachybotrys elegans TaxID=80388 RepID=A0A8K0SDJ2_9HYPO|nr:kelch repeat protein [Stachybotrys elegans]
MAFPSATWTRLASETRLQRSSQCVSVLGSALYIFGGEVLPREPVDNHLHAIELGENSRNGVTVKTLDAPSVAPTPRVGSAATSIQDAMYLFSGRGGVSMGPMEEDGALWKYSSSTSQWSLVAPADPSAPFPKGRSYHVMASNGVDEVFVHAGCPEKGRLSDLWSFNVASRAWTKLPDAPEPARGGTSLAHHRGKLYRMNGFDGKDEQGGSLDVFDTHARAWTTLSFPADGKQAPEARSVATLMAVPVGEQGFLVTMFGERDPSSLGHAGAGKMLGDVWAFDLGAGTWSAVKPANDAPPPRGWFDAALLTEPSGRPSIIVHGGLAEDNTRLGDVWRLDLGDA